MARSGSSQKVAGSLVAMSSAAVLAVYSAGYVRTRPAADQLAKQALERTLARQVPPEVVEHHDPAGVTPAAPKLDIAAVPSQPKNTTVAGSKQIAPSASPNASVQVPPSENAPASVEAPAPVAAPSSVAATPVPSAEEQPVAVSITAPPAPAPKVWKDGKYIGWGGSRHGDIQATIVIEGGRIVSAEISDCQTRYPCDVIEKLPPQVITRQSPNVQRVSGATESADAFYSAVYFALEQAK